MKNNIRKTKSLYISILFFFLSILFISFGFFYDYYYSEKNLLSVLNLTDDTEITDVDNDEGKSSNNSKIINPGEITDNSTLRDNIQKRYGINIKYGDELSNYTVGGLSVNTLSDDTSINTALRDLNYNLSLYPGGFFEEFSKKGLSLTVNLIKSFSTDNITGITDSTNKDVIISIACDYSFAESINHEIYQYIDKYISLNNGSYGNWNIYNPVDFTYGTRIENYAYTRTKSSDSYFVNMYAEENEYEDRASTFEYMMGNDNPPFFKLGSPINNKADKISMMIKNYFVTASNDDSLYWNRYIKH